MEKQLIISVGREYASGGHNIAEELAKRFNIKLYDNSLLLHIAEKHGGNLETISRYDETPKLKILSRTVRGYNNSPEDMIAQMQFDYIREMADAGESFVIVGRCAETVLKGHPALVSVFVLGDYDAKLKRVMSILNVTEKEAKTQIKTMDKKKKSYHNYHCDLHWGDSRLYDLSINSSRLGIDETVDAIEEYIKRRIDKNN